MFIKFTQPHAQFYPSIKITPPTTSIFLNFLKKINEKLIKESQEELGLYLEKLYEIGKDEKKES